MPISLALVVLKTHHPERLKAFYELLGIRFRAEKHGNGPTHFAGEAGHVLLEIYPLREGACDATRLGFRVDQPEAVMLALESAAVPTLTPTATTPWGMRTVVQDPDQRPVEIYWTSQTSGDRTPSA